jgi:hypothetical protein
LNVRLDLLLVFEFRQMTSLSSECQLCIKYDPTNIVFNTSTSVSFLDASLILREYRICLRFSV